MKKKYLILPFLFGLLVLGVMIMIYCFSAENGAQSTATSNGVTKFVIKIIKPDFDSMSGADKTAYFAKVAHYVRKAAHFTEYFLLGLFSSLLLASLIKNPSGKSLPLFILPVLFSTLYAVFDEGHQRFVGGRAAQLTDVLIDASGALVATVFVCIVFFIAERRRS